MEREPASPHVKKIVHLVYGLLRNPAFGHGLGYYIEGDPKEVKAFSNQGTVKIDDREIDVGSFVYTVLLNMSMELAQGCDTDVWHERLRTLTDNWPSLEAKWKPTKGSMVRKGDVIEVCLAFCRETGPAIPPQTVVWRNRFLRDVKEFNRSLKDVVRFICRCDDGYPTSKYLPNPTHFARLVVFVWSGIRNHNEGRRDDSVMKADVEKESLMNKNGADNW